MNDKADEGITTRHVIPATPGFELVTALVDPHDVNRVVGLALEPIVAWIVTYNVKNGEIAYRYAWPVSFTFVPDVHGIKLPNGDFEFPGDTTFHACKGLKAAVIEHLQMWLDQEREFKANKEKARE
jgi:hypothetical protein